MRRVSRAVREEAALICAVEASTPDLTGHTPRTTDALGFSAEARVLAFDAEPAHYAEAELLLREGWTPPLTVWA